MKWNQTKKRMTCIRSKDELHKNALFNILSVYVSVCPFDRTSVCHCSRRETKKEKKSSYKLGQLFKCLCKYICMYVYVRLLYVVGMIWITQADVDIQYHVYISISHVLSQILNNSNTENRKVAKNYFSPLDSHVAVASGI